MNNTFETAFQTIFRSNPPVIRGCPKPTYDERRAKISREYQDDAQGFYAAEAQLKLRYNRPLNDDNEQAIVAANQAVVVCATNF